jgi:hypothetical protein
MGWFGDKSPKTTGDEYVALMVTLLIDGEQALFVVLGADGSITRVGDGSADNPDHDMFIGLTAPDSFARCGTE